MAVMGEAWAPAQEMREGFLEEETSELRPERVAGLVCGMVLQGEQTACSNVHRLKDGKWPSIFNKLIIFLSKHFVLRSLWSHVQL